MSPPPSPPEAASPQPSPGRCPPDVWGFGLLALAKALALGPLFLYRGFAWWYPFWGGDGGEWLSNGLALFGADTRTTGRQPLLPFLLGLLDQVHALRFFPWIPLALATALCFGLFLAVRRREGAAVAWVCGLYVLLHHGLLEQSVEVMADLLATTLLTASIFVLVRPVRSDPSSPVASSGRPGGRSRSRRAFGIALGASSVLAQQVALVPLGAVLLWRAAREPRREAWPSAGSLAGIALPHLLWQLWLRGAGRAGGAAITPQAQWGYLRLHLDALDHSLLLTLAYLGLPAVALALWGAARILRADPARGAGQAEGPPALSWAVVWLASVAGFFTFLYVYRAARFGLYGLPPFVLCLGAGLAALRPRRVLFALASLALIAGGAWPHGAGAARTGLWPLPPVELVGGEGGEGRDPAGPRLEGVPAGELLRRSLPSRAFTLWREVGERRNPDPPGLGTVRTVVTLYADGTSIEGRYDLRDRAGNTLRRPAKLVPCSLFPRRWKGWSDLREVERTGEIGFYRSPRGVEQGDWLMVAPESCAPPTPLPAAAVPRPEEERALAESIEKRLPGPEAFVAVIAEGEGAEALARVLALTLRTPNFFVLDRATAERLPRDPAPAPQGERLGPFRLFRVHYNRWPALLLEPLLPPA